MVAGHGTAAAWREAMDWGIAEAAPRGGAIVFVGFTQPSRAAFFTHATCSRKSAIRLHVGNQADGRDRRLPVTSRDPSTSLEDFPTASSGARRVSR